MRILSAITLIFFAHAAAASPLTIPSHSNLLENADLVIIAHFIKTDETEMHRKVSSLDAVAVWSDFQVTAFLKGSSSNQVATVMHYKPLPPASGFWPVQMTSGPRFSFVSFIKSYQHYLIYLKSDGNKRYFPVTGVEDPEYSFWKLSSK
jgi:hypothetical protein